MRELFWRGIARIISSPRIADWLIERSFKTPYTPITGPDGSLYMGRWWLFNPYPAQSDGGKRRWGDWLPSVRIHHIMRPDVDRHLHDHPWNARTIILNGSYKEELPGGRVRYRVKGDTGTLKFGEYHRIAMLGSLSQGVWTMFITWKYQGTWGFDVDGVKVPWRQYLKVGKS